MHAHPKTALVFSGGGSLGAVQVGMLQAISRTCMSVDMVVGASVGALNGAFYANDPTPDGIDRLTRLWCRLRRRDVFPLTLFAGLTALLSGRDHLVEADGLRRVVEHSLGAQRVEDTRVPLHIVATDVLDGESVLLSSGDLATALMASTAIPVVFPHVEMAGRCLVDGGVSNNTPIASAVALGAEHVVVLPTGTPCAMQEPPRDMAALALHVMALQNMRQLDRDVKRFATRARITLVPPLCPLGVSVFDFSHTARLVERAASRTRDWLAQGGLDQTGPLPVPLAHHHPDVRPANACAGSADTQLLASQP